MRDFNLKDFDATEKMQIIDRSHREANDIKKNPKQRRGRTDQRILEDCMMGQAAEVFMISKYNYRDDPRRFKDTFNTRGKSVDQKVIGYDDPQWTLDNCKNIIENESWREFPHIVQIWYNKRNTDEYIWKGEYHYERISKSFTRVC